MNEARAARIEAKYSGSKAQTQKKQMDMGKGAGHDRAMGASGKPKDLKNAIVRLIKYLSHEKVLIASALICSIIYTVSSLAASYLLRPIINKFIYFDEADTDLSARLLGLAIWLIILAVIYGISILAQWLQQRLMLLASQRTLVRMRSELFAKLQSLPVRYFDTHQTGDIMSRFTNDVDTVGEMLNTTLIQIISGVITIVGTIVLMLYTNPILGAITIVATPILTYLSKTIMKKGRKAYKEQQKNLGMLNGFTEETISGQKVVQVFHHEEIVRDEFAYLNQKLCRSQEQAQFRACCS